MGLAYLRSALYGATETFKNISNVNQSQQIQRSNENNVTVTYLRFKHLYNEKLICG